MGIFQIGRLVLVLMVLTGCLPLSRTVNKTVEGEWSNFTSDCFCGQPNVTVPGGYITYDYRYSCIRNRTSLSFSGVYLNDSVIDNITYRTTCGEVVLRW